MQGIAVLPANLARSNALPAGDNELQELSPLQLVRRCLRSGDERAWQEFVRRFQPLIAATVIRTLRRGNCFSLVLVDDLVQDTYIKVFAHNFRALRKFEFRHEKALFGFFRVVASNVVQDYLRIHYSKKHGCGKVQEDLESIKISTAANHGFVEKTQRRILVTQIKQYLMRLAAESDFTRNYAIFQLYFEQGLTAKAIAGLPYIGLSTKGVESALGRVTRMIKEAIDTPSGHWQ